MPETTFRSLAIMDPVITPLLVLVLGDVAKSILEDACKDHLKDKVKSLFGRLEATGQLDKVERAYVVVMERAYATCLESLLLVLKSAGRSDDELREYRESLLSFVKDKDVGKELLSAIREPHRDDLPSPGVLGERWAAAGGRELPGPWVWNAVASGFREHAKKQVILSDELRELANAQTQAHAAELLGRQAGVRVPADRNRYARRMRAKFSPVDLANLMPAAADDPGRLVIRDVFVPQLVRENPPPVELPKDVAERIALATGRSRDGTRPDGIDADQAEILRASFARQPPRPVLEVVASPRSRLLVLTGEPGSGKSTLMRYLLTTLLEPADGPLPAPAAAWAAALRGGFPLLIELRDFHALRAQGECDTFLEYVAYMGRTDQWFLDDHAANELLENGPSLVMFDGLDEILDPAAHQRTMNEIAAFAERYPSARIIVTTRPVGYRDHTLRNAGFAHHGIQDLSEEQVATFVRGWFALTFPHDTEKAEQRVGRVLGSVRRSRPIRLLAGNPMLLTIMALLAREAELPRERARFYEKAVEVLCHHWDANRNLGLPDDRYLTADDKKALLQRVAMRMQVGDGGLRGNVIHGADLEDEVEAFLKEERWQTDPAEARKAARRMIRQLRERNYILCLRGPNLYGFVHRTFLEYLTAAEYVRRFERQPQRLTLRGLLELFDRHGTDDDWREVLRLVCGQLDERIVSRVMDRLSDGADREVRQSPRIAALCLAISSVGEVRNAAKLNEVACEKLLHAALKEFLNGDWDEVTAIVDTAEELGKPWPYPSTVATIASEDLPSVEGYRAELWVLFILALHPDRATADAFAASISWAHRAGAFRALASKWPDERTRTFLEARVVEDEKAGPRGSALASLAESWPDERTRTFLEARAVVDEAADPRSTALDSLARTWPNERTRTFLEARAVEDEAEGPRSTALMALARSWPDERTRTFLEARAVEDEVELLRKAALGYLASSWPDERTRTFLKARAVEDEAEGHRSTALLILARSWPDERTRTFLEARAVEDEARVLRRTALRSLASSWPDERTRTFLEVRAVEDEADVLRGTALDSLARSWPDERTRTFLEARAIEDEAAVPRSTALDSLAESWPDERTRTFLEARAIEDEAAVPRSSALDSLAESWSDERTRTFLEARAVVDEGEYARDAALEALASKWPDERTENYVANQAATSGFATSRLAAGHSEFGRVLFTRDADGLFPYLDPTQAMSRDQIVKTARRTGVPPEDVDRLVAELSAHLGWNVREGSGTSVAYPPDEDGVTT
jgi:energy-coupling factor transporter ATP-binding protein EcfA2